MQMVQRGACSNAQAEHIEQHNLLSQAVQHPGRHHDLRVGGRGWRQVCEWDCDFLTVEQAQRLRADFNVLE